MGYEGWQIPPLPALAKPVNTNAILPLFFLIRGLRASLAIYLYLQISGYRGLGSLDARCGLSLNRVGRLALGRCCSDGVANSSSCRHSSFS